MTIPNNLNPGLRAAIFGRSRWSSTVRRIAAAHCRAYVDYLDWRWTAADHLKLLTHVALAKRQRPHMETYEDFARWLMGF